jgi:hypothetical protein
MFNEWIEMIVVMYGVFLPPAYAAWVWWRERYPKWIILHDLYRHDEPIVLRRAA